MSDCREYPDTIWSRVYLDPEDEEEDEEDTPIHTPAKPVSAIAEAIFFGVIAMVAAFFFYLVWGA